MKSMTLTYIPPREYRDDSQIALALFSASPSITLLDYNFPRISIKDVKGFEVIILLFSALFRDILKSGEKKAGLSFNEVKKETSRLQKMEIEAEERARRQKAEEIDRETEHLRRLAREEFLARRAREEEVERETERLRKLEGWYPPEKDKKTLKITTVEKPSTGKKSSPTTHKKHWWSSGGNPSGGQWSSRDICDQGHGPKYSMTGARLMGYSI
jgi:hypothetical protein